MNLRSGPACWGRRSQASPDHCRRLYTRPWRSAVWPLSLHALFVEFASSPETVPFRDLGHGSTNAALLTDWQGAVLSY